MQINAKTIITGAVVVVAGWFLLTKTGLLKK